MSRMGHTLWMAGLAALLAGCGGGRIAEAERGERETALYRKAFAAEQAGDIKEAVRLFNRVLIEEPRSFSAHFQLATLLQDREEDYFGAIYHYRRYLELRPESEKSTLAHDRIRVAEQMLAPRILKKVGDSVQGITQAHLLKENDRLNRALTALEGEKSVLLEEKAGAEKELERLKGDNERLRGVLQRLRVAETVPADGAASRGVGAAAARDEADAPEPPKTDAQAMKALREEAEALAAQGRATPPARKPVVDVPSTESVLKKVEERLAGAPAKPEAEAAPAPAGKTGARGLSPLSLFVRDEKKEGKKTGADGAVRTYVVQPGDTLFRVSEKFYGDATKWTRIRDANRANVDPDGRIRAGQIIVVP